MRTSSRWRSIEWNLPLLISGLLVAVIVAFAIATYGQLRRLVITSAEDRAGNAAQQVSGLFATTLRHTRQGARQLAADTTFARALAHPDDAAARARATQRFTALLAATPRQLAAIELRDAGRQPVLRAGASLPAVTAVIEASLRAPAAPDARLTPLVAIHDSLYAGVIAPVIGEHADTLGYLVQYARLALQGGSAIRQLIGSRALFLLGNADGSLWTDLDHVTRGPAIERRRGHVPTRDTIGGDVRLGAYSDISLTPWTVWVGFPERAVLAPVRSTLLRMLYAGLVILLVGAGAGWVMSRRLTRPLSEVTRAAEGIASGDYTQRVGTPRPEELARLAAAFNIMAAKVDDSRRDLEQRVADRTLELSAAVEQLRAAQEELVRKEKLALLGQLAGGVGHELRNPLGVMTNAVHYLGLVLADAPPTVVEYLGILRTQIGLSERIVGDLLDSARVKTPQREPVAIAQLVADQVQRIGPLDRVTVTLDVPPDLPRVCVDRMQMGQVMLNLLINAVQAMGDRAGTVTVRARPGGSGHLHVDVTDTGSGISPEHLDKIFEPLYTTKARGLGLGLSVARALTAANDGRLTVASTPGVGSTFTLVLPTLAAVAG